MKRLNGAYALAVAFGFVAMISTGPAAASSFRPFQTYAMPVWPQTWPDVATVADVNGDGRLDAVVATTKADQGSNAELDHMLYLFLQQGNGVLAPYVRIAYSSVSEEGDNTRGFRKRTGIARADLNKDGIDDVVVGRREGLSIMYGSRTGSYPVRRIRNTTGAASGDAIVILDIDADGFLDIVTHNETSGDGAWGITAYFADDSGSFARQRFLATRSEGGIELKVGDLNGDRRDDLALSWMQGLNQGVEIFYGDGAGWFAAGQFLNKPAKIRTTDTIAIGDFDGGDGRDDLVVAGSDWDFDAKKIYLYKQSGDGSLAAPVLLLAGDVKDTADSPDSSIAFDANGDRTDDLLIIRSGGLLGYLEQLNGRLAQERLFPGPYLTWSGLQPLAGGDVNSDGCADVVAANSNYGLVVWYGQDCSVEMNGSAPLLPPAPTLVSVGADTHVGTQHAATTARQLARPGADSRSGEWNFLRVLFALGLLGLLGFGAWAGWRSLRPWGR